MSKAVVQVHRETKGEKKLWSMTADRYNQKLLSRTEYF